MGSSKDHFPTFRLPTFEKLNDFRENLREIVTKFNKILWGETRGPWDTFQEKNPMSKISCYSPFKEAAFCKIYGTVDCCSTHGTGHTVHLYCTGFCLEEEKILRIILKIF